MGAGASGSRRLAVQRQLQRPHLKAQGLHDSQGLLLLQQGHCLWLHAHALQRQLQRKRLRAWLT